MKGPTLICLGTALALGACASVLLMARSLPEPPSFSKVRQAYRVSDPVILDRSGDVIHEFRADARVRRLDWTPLEEVSPELIRAVVAAEDKRFFLHVGFDPLAFGMALYDRVAGRKLRGASTIPMQLGPLLDAQASASAPIRARKSFVDKLRETARSALLSIYWSKQEILEAYLNLVYFRGELQGVAAASRGLFARAPLALDVDQSTVLASLIRSPNASPDKVGERACALSLAIGTGSAGCSGARFAAEAALSVPYAIGTRAALAPHVAQIALKSFSGETRPNAITTTIDGRLQRFLIEALKRQVLSLQSQNMNDGAALVLENKSGDVLAYVGNVGAASSARFVDGVRARRQAGSTLKPFLYGRAIDERLMTAATLLRDSPFEVSVQTGSYVPQNYDRGFKAFVPARVALASSLNVPAVRVLEMLGVDRFVETLSSFGMTGLERPDFYGPSLALGSADVTLWELANAYRALANKGVWTEARLLPSAPGAAPADKRVALSAEAAYVVASMLSDREARSVTFGLENALATRFWSAVKTGTSKDMRDNWTIGFSDTYTVAVWSGNFAGDPMWNVSGVHGAAPVWLETMNYLHASASSSEAPAPPALVQMRVVFPDSGESKDEFFISGTEPVDPEIRVEAQAETRLLYPVTGVIVALDPRIDAGGNRLHFQVSNPRPGYELVLNGMRVASAKDEFVPWQPVAGRHQLSLIGPDRRVIDSVSFVVRGRAARTISASR